jgi:hypothetical protein
MTIGEKRNRCCQLASGEIICHFDSDDWSAPDRVTDQMNRLLESGVQMTGYHSMFFWTELLNKAFRYAGDTNYCMGTSMMYRRELWEKNHFPQISCGEDNFLWNVARGLRSVVTVDAGQRLIARAHANTTSDATRTGQNSWPQVSRDALPKQFFLDCGYV